MPLAEPVPGRTDVRVAIGAWALAVAVIAVGPALADLDPEAPSGVPGLGSPGWWVGIAVVTAQAVALLWRRRSPGLVLLAVAAGTPLPALVGGWEAGSATSVAVLVAAYTLAVSGSRLGKAPFGKAPFGKAARSGLPAVVAGLPAVIAAVALVGLSTYLVVPETVDDAAALGTSAVQGVLVVGLAVGVGLVVGTRREAAQAQARQVEAVSREHAARVEAAVARERAEMARELHDIAAHHLSGIAVMTGAIGRQIDADPQAAKAGVARVRAETSAMLDELRSLVRLLRDTPGPESRLESLNGIAALVERVRESGVDASLTVLGMDEVTGTEELTVPSGVVGPLAQLAVHRTVQEALANVVRHAPGARCEVVLDGRQEGRLVVSVRNGPPRGTVAARLSDDGGGLGLVGMQERADLTDAHLAYGPQPDGGWLVMLTVPTHKPTSTEGDPA